MFDFARNVFEFVVFTVFLKAIVAHWLADKIVLYGGRLLSKTERNLAIWSHYQMRALGDGHRSGNILHCREGKCSVL